MNYVFIKLCFTTIISLLFSIAIMIPVHEAGHLIGGILSGYRLTMLEICGFKLMKRKGRISFKYKRRLPPGQCIMHPKCITQNCLPLIAGGIAANIVTGCLLLIGSLFVSGQNQMIFLICTGGMNVAAGIMSWTGSSDSCDGNTLREILHDRRRTTIYNRLMLIYTELEYGKGYAELSDYLFESTDIYSSSLSAELAMFRLMRTVACCKEGTSFVNEVNAAKLKYEKHGRNMEIEGGMPGE